MKHTPLSRIASLLGLDCEDNTPIRSYQIDSRKIEPGCLFFALSGEKTDGHFYLRQVRSQGAIAAVVSSSYRGESYGLHLLSVKDVKQALHTLAHAAFLQKKVPFIGITGSVGKTTTKDFLATLLQSKYRVAKSYKSYNTQLTFPLNWLNLSGEEEVIVFEMGLSQPGDMDRLLDIAEPDIALVTKVGMAHAAYFPRGQEQIAQEKARIFERLVTKQLVFDAGLLDWVSLEPLSSKAKVSFSLERREVDYFLSQVDGGICIDEKGVRAHQMSVPFDPPHFLHDFLAAVSVARLMKLSWAEIEQQAATLELPKMRFEREQRNGVCLINDAYNANPESMRAALSHLPDPEEGGKKIAVLGTMSPLGEFSDECHREIGQFAQKYVDHLLAFGEETAPLCKAFQEVQKPAEHFISQEALIERLKVLMCPGDVVLIKGSRIMEMEKIIQHLG